MSPLTIGLIVVGVVILAVSFFIPDREDSENKKDIELQREEIKRLMESELDGMRLRVNEATNETVEYGMDKYERSLEKIANEKIMAVNEYSTTVMAEIDKNHKEVLFLYDMLNDKQAEVKNTVRNAEAAAREITDAVRSANDTVANVVKSASVVKADMEASIDEYSEKQSKVLEQRRWQNQRQFGDNANVQSGFGQESFGGQPVIRAGAGGGVGAGSGVGRQSYVNSGVVESLFTKFDASSAVEGDSLITPINALRSQGQDAVKQPEPAPVDEFAELQKTTFKNVSNNNQQIIMLSKEGKSVIEIAKELGLGVGEVQLVLDLFK